MDCFLFGPTLLFLTKPVRCLLFGIPQGPDSDQQSLSQKCTSYYWANILAVIVAVVFNVTALVFESLSYDKEVFIHTKWSR